MEKQLAQKKKKTQSQKYSSKILIVSLVAFFVLSQFVIFSVAREPWFDVSFSLETVHLLHENGPLSISWAEYDVHPPVYYYALYGWSFLNPGMTEYHWGQELSVLFGLLFIFFAGLGLKKLFGVQGALVTLFFAFSTTIWHYGTEVRAYMLLMMISAFIFYAVANWMRGWRGIVAYGLLIVLPFIHYFSGIVMPFYILLYLGLSRKGAVEGKERVVKVLGMATASIVSTAIAFFVFALPQMSRTAGTLFQAPSLSSFSSSLFYSMFVIENPVTSLTSISVAIYVVFNLFLMAILVYGLFKIFANKVWLNQDIILLILFLSGIFPLGMLAILSLLGGVLPNIYHHRFFLVLIWCFAAATYILVIRAIEKARIVAKVLIIILLVLLMVFMQVKYVQSTYHELDDLARHTPCPEEQVAIAHESMFSLIPYEVYARELGCNWYNFVSTNLDEKFTNGRGFDAISEEEQVFRNFTLPPHEFLYVQSGDVIPLGDRYTEIMYESNGVWLTYVGPENNR